MADPKYDEDTAAWLAQVGVPYTERNAPIRKTKEPMPYNTAGLPGLMVRNMPYLENTNASGLVLSSNRLADEQRNRALQQNMFVQPQAEPQVIGHEAEHLLARQNAGFAEMPREFFNTLVEQGGTKAYRAVPQFLDGLVESLPYLEKKYGIKNGYMNKDFIKEDGRLGLHEIFATLAGAEATLGVDLTKDPELRKTMFKDKAVREAYNAVTGLRQTRLDPRDLPPYTRVPEKQEGNQGFMDKVKKLFGYAEGGMIPEAGNKKLI